MKKTYNIEVDCANCAAKMEEAAQKTGGVREAVVSFMTQKMKVEFDDGADEAAVRKKVLKNCKRDVYKRQAISLITGGKIASASAEKQTAGV